MGELIVLMGPTGAGKSVQGDILAKDLGGVHLSSGNLLRQDPRTAEKLVSGMLMPESEIERVVGAAIAAVPQDQPIVLDGTPRTVDQIHWLDGELRRDGRELKRVIMVDLGLDTIMQRLRLRDRADDAPQVIEVKWNEFQTKTKPVVEAYRETGLLRVIDGSGSVEQVAELVKAALA